MQSDGVVEPILADFKSKSHDHRHCVAAALAAAEELCADRGLRLTALRRRVLELIWGRHRPARAYDLLDQFHDIADPALDEEGLNLSLSKQRARGRIREGLDNEF